MAASLTERERQVLEAVIETYGQTAEPAGSRTIARRFGLALSAASIRNTMSDLEEKGYLYHPHTSAGRIPTDLAYRVYVDSLMHLPPVTASESHHIREELGGGGERNAVDQILERAAQVLALKSGVVRTIFVEVSSQMAREAVAQVAVVLNERLAGLTLKHIRATLPDRLRDATAPAESGAGELLNIFIQEADELFDVRGAGAGAGVAPGGVVLGSAQLLAGQPEFAT